MVTTHFFLILKINFRKMASNKHVNLRKTENFVSSKYYPEDISKGKGSEFQKELISENFVRALKSLMGIEHTKGNKSDNDKKPLLPQYHSILL